MSKRNTSGFVPNQLLLDIASLNAGNLSAIETIAATQRIAQAAAKGTVRYKIAKGASERQIYTAGNASRLPGTKARFEGDKATSDNVVNDAYEFHGKMRDFLLQVFKRNSIDGAGMNLIGTVHYGKGYNNAFWNGQQMTYGDGDQQIFATFVLIDVIGHEMFHGVTEHTSGLEYSGESGALNESMSDVFGVCLRQWANGHDVTQDSWLVGPGIFTSKVKGAALRSMTAPGTAYNDPRLGKDPQPDHYSKLYTGSSDNGGVHINSGIPNKAFATFAIAVGGKSWDVALPVWFESNCGANRVGPNADFSDFAKKTVDNCTKMFPQHVAALKSAWNGVGVTV
ncbi:MAG: M4 family metallopeptidase [Cyanobacteria bacterium SZAS LIN-3]|nr:M4 family metallopeptidase [Cyanobacteria bacterium SZAS LIN-3]